MTNSGKDQDLTMKLQVASALAVRGYYCNINVRLSATAEGGLIDVTDADVLAIAHDLTFAPRIVAATCKSGRKVTIAKEVFYLRGLLEYLRADEGIALFRVRIPAHLRDLGRKLDVLVLGEGESDSWHGGIIGGISNTGYFDSNLYEELEKSLQVTEMQSLNEWLTADFWFFRDFRNFSRGVSRLRGVIGRLTGKSRWHEVVFLNVAAHLSLTVLDLCRTVRMLGVDQVMDTTSAYLFGGLSSYRGRKELYNRVQQVLSRTGLLEEAGAALPPLEPPYAAKLAELAIRYVDRPSAAIRVPQVLQNAMWVAVGGKGLGFDEDVDGLASQKLAQDLLEFLRSAAGGTWHPELFGMT